MEYLTSDKQESNILKFKKKKQLNIGIIIFGIIFVYLIATIIIYITKPHVTVYEVRQGSLLKDTTYTGLAIRDETVINSDASGYINYYALENSKVKVGSDIYTLSSKELNFEETPTDEELSLTKEEQYAVMLQIQDFNHDFQESVFSNCYYLKKEIQNTLGSHSSQSRLNQLHTMLNQNNLDVSVYSAKDDGIIVYSVDGLEGLTLESATLENLNQSNYKKTQFSNNSKINAGDAVYKIVTNDKWSLMVELTKETAEYLQEKNDVKVNFVKDNQTMWANFELKKIDGKYIAYLHFDESMIRYVNERYLDIELILEDETGLKIPKSAETEKEFYVIPKSYITQGGNSSSSGVLRQTTNKDGNTITEFVTVTIYYDDGEIVYLDPSQFKEEDLLLKEDSTDTIQLKEKRTLKGVYCINKGYAVFKQIAILCESDTYYIIEEGNSYGLSNYDHIALDSTNIQENDVVF